MDGIRALVQAHWDLGYLEFCKYLDLDPRSIESRCEWELFMKAGDALRNMGNANLSRLVQYQPGMVKA